MGSVPADYESAKRAPQRSRAKDVARLAGVSTATVSRVLNSPDRVDTETRRIVIDAVRKLRYVPHGAARALRSHRSRMIGAVVPSFGYALYARTTSAMQAVLDAHGYSLVVAEHHYDLRAELRITEQLVGRGVDAMVFVGVDHDPALFAVLADYGRPYVLTWGVDPMQRHPSIGFDNRAATFEITRHLIGLGHSRFGLLSAVTDGNDRATERGAGVRAALAQAGLVLDERYVRYGPINLEAAAAMMHELLASTSRPTAVVATNDVFAVGAMIACREAGVAIPRDISVTGVDNTDLGASQTPPLTSIRTPIVEIGRAAAEQVIARLEGHPYESFQAFPFELVRRGSTARPRQ
jgi:LacI family transcriptional regulator